MRSLKILRLRSRVAEQLRCLRIPAVGKVADIFVPATRKSTCISTQTVRERPSTRLSRIYNASPDIPKPRFVLFCSCF